MITISTCYYGTDKRYHWKVSRRIDDTAPYYKSGHYDAFKDAQNVADYCLSWAWCCGVRVKHNGLIIREDFK